MIPLICNLPFIENCFKSEDNSKITLKQPFHIKIAKIKEMTLSIKKIMWVALIVLICVGIFITPIPSLIINRVNPNNISSPQIPGYLFPYSRNLTPTLIPDTSSPNSRFPSHFHPEKIYGENRHVCFLSKSKPTSEDCFKVNGYQEALLYIEQEVMGTSAFFEKDVGAIVEAIKKTNAIATQYLKDSGGLRKNIAFLLPAHTNISRKGLQKAFFKQGGTAQDIRTFHSLYDKLEKFDLLDKALKHLNEREFRALKLIGYISCLPDKIDSKLITLVRQMKALIEQIKDHKTDTLAVAAYVHQELVKINPFMHGNKATARLWMYVILKTGGFEAITFSKQDYEWEITKDLKSPGSFTTYLKQSIDWHRKGIHQTLNKFY